MMDNHPRRNPNLQIHVATWLAASIFALAALALPQTAMAQGTRWAWGYNIKGQLGNYSTSNSNVPVQVTSTLLTSAIAVSGGYEHSMALKNDGTVWTWGWNLYGQLGQGNNGEDYNSTVPVKISSLSGMTAVAAGGYHSLALKSDGTVRAWGYNYYGQLGDNSTTERDSPVNVSIAGVTAIACGGYHSLALKSDGTVWAWGNGSYGQLGNGANASINQIPVQVLNLTGIKAIAAGFYHSLALKNDGTVWAWGYNLWGQLGTGNNNNSNVPVKITTLSGMTAIAAGGTGASNEGSHSLALKNDGTVWAWGWNYYGQLGNGTNTDSNSPVQVSGLGGIKAIAAGGWHSLAVTTGGLAKAWGYNSYGELGNGHNANSNVPVAVSNITGVTGIAGGGYHSLAFSYPLPSEIGTQAWSDKDTQTWPADSLASSYNLYRGTPSQLPALLTTSNDSCLRYGNITTTSATTSENPSSGSFFWYLVTGVNVAGEGSAGNATAGARIVNSSGTCP
jgi:alpha-tubulin suppressor-like RCC1 family protein